MTFLLSTVALLSAPFLYALADERARSRQALDGFILVTIAGIVCLHIVPDAWRTGGVASLGFLLAGLAFPVVLEATFSRAMHRAHLFVVVVAAFGIVVHAILDGFALLPLEPGSGLLGNGLALGVILHRLPVGMAIWWVLRPHFGTPVAVATFAVVILATAASYFLGAEIIGLEGAADTASLAFFQSFVAGSLVHVVLFGSSHDHGETSAPRMESWAFRGGLLLGLVMVFLLPHIHGA